MPVRLLYLTEKAESLQQQMVLIRYIILTALPYILTFRSNDAATHRVGHRAVLQPGLHRMHLIKIAAQGRLSHRNTLVDKDFGQL